jgi:hypothetical protein
LCRFFKKQKLQSAAAQIRRKAQRPKYMPSWTRHDIWLEEGPQSQSTKIQTTQTQTTQKTQPTKTTQVKTEQVPPQTQQVTNPPPPTEEKKEEKKSRFKFW